MAVPTPLARLIGRAEHSTASNGGWTVEERSFAPHARSVSPADLLRIDRIRNATVSDEPFRHVLATDVVSPDFAGALHRDMPEITKTGFFEAEGLDCGPWFKALLDAMAAPAFSEIIGKKLGLDLVSRPQLLMVRKWSGPRDGRPHTDGVDKAATALLYLNPAWESYEGALRYLQGPDLEGPGTAPIPPVFGTLTAFARSETSWHGHPQFIGERRVIQLFWMVDEAALARKHSRHHRQLFVRWFRNGAA